MATKDAFDRANPNTLADLFRLAQIGKVLRGQIPQVARKVAPAADAGVDATMWANGTPYDARAAGIVSAYARAGAGVVGPLVIAAPGVLPAASEIGIAPNGDLVTLAADAWTDLDVTYIPERGDVITYQAAVVANAIALPSNITDRGVVRMLDATVTAGASTGRKVIALEGAAPAAGEASLDAAKANVAFFAAEATEAIVTLLVSAADDLGAILESDDATI